MLNFEVFGNAIFGLVTRWYAIGYAIKVLIINSVTRFLDFLYIFIGWHEKNKKNIYMGEYRKVLKSRNRVTESFCRLKVFGRFLSVGSFCEVFGNGVFGRFLVNQVTS
jgi:hypothetical protein